MKLKKKKADNQKDLVMMKLEDNLLEKIETRKNQKIKNFFIN